MKTRVSTPPLLSLPQAPSHPRFRVLGTLGSGGRGTVYEAIDRLHGSRVAIKSLNGRRVGLERELKADFRRLADIHHPNLVDYYELHTDGQVLFFSMSLIEGFDPETWLRADLRRGEPLPPDRHRQLEQVILQLAAAVQALHDRGILHRDIKPSNVLVEPDGRVVLLDFGLATAWPRASGPRRTEGTPSYMAPEQLAFGECSPASDWYAVGAIIGELLTGEKPRPLRSERAPASGPASSLEALVEALMARDPAARPGVTGIERSLGRRRPTALAEPSLEFVGRSSELEQLRQAWFRVQSEGRAVAVTIRGPSGIGKSTLLDRFVSALESSGVRPEVLRGRCHPRETLPYGGLDAWIDHLAGDGAAIARAAARVPAETDIGVLGVVFPALAAALGHPSPRTGADRQRPEASRALGHLLAAWSEARPLVLVCDDAQWVDPDSASIMRQMVQYILHRPILLLFTERTELPDPPRFDATRDLPGLPAVPLRLGPLSRDESLELLERHAPRFSRHHEDWVAAAGGSPLLLGLLSEVEDDPGASDPWWHAIYGRLARLQPGARRLLEWVCVHRGPLDPRLVSEADPTDLGRVIAALVKARWLRYDDRGEIRRVAPHHDRIREAVLGNTDAARLREVHGRLADALVDRHGSVSEIAGHLIAARRTGAGGWAARAGFEAAHQHAYAQAREWLALALENDRGVDREAVLAQLGEVCRHLGLVEPGARAYLEAAELAEPRSGFDAVLHRCRASEILLAAGHLDEGRSVLDGLLDRVGLSRPARGALGVLRAGFARAWVRSLAVPEPRAEPLSGRDLRRLEVAYTAVTALGLTDSVSAGLLQAEHLRLAASGGDAEQLARALAMDLVYRAASGRENEDHDRVEKGLGDLLPSVDSEELRAFARGSIGYARFLRGDFLAARRLLAASADAHARLSSASWTSRFVEIHLAINDIYLGALEEAFAREARVRDAFVATRDHVALAYLGLGVSYVRALADDDPDEVEAVVRHALEPWPEAPPVLAYLARTAELHAALYRGDVAGAGRLYATRPSDPLSRLAFQHMRILEAWFRGWLALARGRWRRAARAARALREEGGWAEGMACALDAGVEARSTWSGAAALAGRAIASFDAHGMRLHARCMAAWAAQIATPGPPAEAALARVARLGVKNPAAMMRVYAPPLPGVSAPR